MSLLNLEEACENRWTYLAFVVLSACMFLALNLMFHSDPLYLGRMGIFMFAMEWSGALRGRTKAAGLWHKRGMRSLFGFVVIGACMVFFVYVPYGRLLASGLFVILNLPLIFMPERRHVAET